MQPIVFADVHISQAEFVKLNQRLLLRTRWWIYFVLLPGVMTFSAWGNSKGGFDPIFVITIIFFLITIYVIVYFQIKKRLAASYVSNKLLQENTTYILDENNIFVQNNLLNMNSSWNDITSIKYLDKYWYQLVSSSGTGYLLNNNFLQYSSSNLEDFDFLLKKYNLKTK